MTAVKLEEMLDQSRGVIDGTAQFLQIRRCGAEDRVLDRIAQVGQQRRGLVLDQIAPVDAVDLGERHQHLNREAALVVLQQIDVGGTDPEGLGHLCLGLLVLAPQLA